MFVGAILASNLIAPDNAIKEEMRFKLFYAQGILEGITTENYPLIATNSDKLKHSAKGLAGIFARRQSIAASRPIFNAASMPSRVRRINGMSMARR